MEFGAYAGKYKQQTIYGECREKIVNIDAMK